MAKNLKRQQRALLQGVALLAGLVLTGQSVAQGTNWYVTQAARGAPCQLVQAGAEGPRQRASVVAGPFASTAQACRTLSNPALCKSVNLSQEPECAPEQKERLRASEHRWFEPWPTSRQSEGPADYLESFKREYKRAGKTYGIGGNECKFHMANVVVMMVGRMDRPATANRICLATVTQRGGTKRLLTSAHCGPDESATSPWRLPFRCGSPKRDSMATCHAVSGAVPGGLSCAGQYDSDDACKRDIAVCEVPHIDECQELPAALEAADYQPAPASGSARVISTTSYCAKWDDVPWFDAWPLVDAADPRSPIQTGTLRTLLVDGDSGGPLYDGQRLLGIVAETLNRPHVIPAWVVPACMWETPVPVGCR